MIYLNEENLIEIGIDWNKAVDVIEEAVITLGKDDYSQPIKPYLRYRNPKNRIIAMPAFVGGNTNMAGIKWIASFPENIDKGIPRANSVIILNNADNGQVEAIINTALLSVIRTASVTGLMIRYFEKNRKLSNVNVGIIGFGPIGQNHFKMCDALLGDKISNFYLYDKRPIIDKENLSINSSANVILAKDWQEVYDNSDIFITCTVTDAPYVDKKPKDGALVLNVSLRDFKDEMYQYVKEALVVDDWEEVCREATTIENWHKKYDLKKEDTISIVDVVKENALKNCKEDYPIMFNPMGMASFDIAMATFYVRRAINTKRGLVLK